MSATLWFAIVSMVLGFVGACFSALASVIAYFVKKGEESQDRDIQELKVSVGQAKETLARYETHVGAGDEDLQAIRTDLRDHVQREEEIFWKKVDAITEAHQHLANAMLQRMAAIEARMPNGEIKELVTSVAELRVEMRGVTGMASSAIKHVEDHDKEAEDWKRRIVALETNAHTRRRTR